MEKNNSTTKKDVKSSSDENSPLSDKNDQNSECCLNSSQNHSPILNENLQKDQNDSNSSEMTPQTFNELQSDKSVSDNKYDQLLSISDENQLDNNKDQMSSDKISVKSDNICSKNDSKKEKGLVKNSKSVQLKKHDKLSSTGNCKKYNFYESKAISEEQDDCVLYSHDSITCNNHNFNEVEKDLASSGNRV